MDRPIKNITFKVKNFNDLKKIENFEKIDGKTDVKIVVEKDNETLTFQLKDKRKINNKLLNAHNLIDYSIIE